MASTDSSQSNYDANEQIMDRRDVPSYSSPNTQSSHVPVPEKLKDDPKQPGPSGPSCSSWSRPPQLPFKSRTKRKAMSASERDRSITSSPSSESSLGESRSPGVIWRDSCVSDMSEFSPDSANCSTRTSLKDESNGSGHNGHSSSGMNSDQEKQVKISQATFDKVLIDASQRRHIRNKARNTGTDSGSDTSSGNMRMDVTKVGGKSQKLESATSESSGIGANYMSSVQCDLTLPRSTIMTGGVTNSSTGVSTMYNSQGNKVSDESKQESMSSGSGGGRKRHLPWSIARYYYQTKQPPVSQDASIDGDDCPVDMSNLSSKRIGQPERKRKRFHRTFTALRQCGLLDLTMQTASLMEQNTKLQKQLGELHRQAHLMYHTVSHFSKIQPTAFGSSEAQKVMDGLKEMVDRNPVQDIDMSLFESMPGSKNSPAIESGAFSTLSNQIPSFSVESSLTSGALRIPGTLSISGSQDNQGPRNSSDSAIQSLITTTSISSEKSGQ
ncbi:uncharacterized protein LOC589800 isoform X2 [Strongylocentrotus purpuratus]|uniref:Uncharacterized protein n=1 Tax=Strongylocentrotus purpuratus TaxID=7668 RepID=A0A7M7T5A1_STRPU|nr:uncharacterized protein LOC589800 isoform X2 [Strongylocentrotus purpuratus]